MKWEKFVITVCRRKRNIMPSRKPEERKMQVSACSRLSNPTSYRYKRRSPGHHLPATTHPGPTSAPPVARSHTRTALQQLLQFPPRSPQPARLARLHFSTVRARLGAGSRATQLFSLYPRARSPFELSVIIVFLHLSFMVEQTLSIFSAFNFLFFEV